MTRSGITVAMALLLLTGFTGLPAVAPYAMASPPAGGTLRDGFSSADALIDGLLQALHDQNRDALQRLRLTESEYRKIVLPGHVAVGETLRRYPEETSTYAWTTLNAKSFHYESKLLAEFGGRTYDVTGVEYAEGTQAYATYTAHKQLRLKLRRDDGREMELETGSIAEIGGRFKFVSYIRD